MSNQRIGVIGAGAAGLAAAWRLRAAGADVVLFEAAESAGGLLHTAVLDGARVDTAVQLLSSTYTRLFALAKDAGVRDLLVRSSGQDALWRKGTAQEITYGNVASMATSGALPTMLKLRMAAKYVPFLTMQAGSLDANDPAGTGGARFDSESIAAWGSREIGDDFVEYLAYPLLAAYYGSPPEETSAALYHALARVGMDVEVYAARGGMGALARALADALRARGVELRAGTRVTRLSAEASGGWLVDAERFDGVVLAAPPDAARLLLASVPEAAAWFAPVLSRPAATVGVVLEGSVRAPYFGISFPRKDAPGDRIVAIAVQRNKPAELLPPGKSALTIFPSPAVVARVAGMDAAAAMAFLGPSLDRVFPGASARVTAAAVYAGERRYRSIAPGLVRRIAELRSLPLPRGLAIAGDYTVAPSVEGAVRSGERAAALLMPQRGTS